jgi:hypothetical protein
MGIFNSYVSLPEATWAVKKLAPKMFGHQEGLNTHELGDSRPYLAGEFKSYIKSQNLWQPPTR